MDLIYWSVLSSRKRGGGRVKGVVGGIVILDSCENHFIRVHKYLVQHPSDNISIYKCCLNLMNGIKVKFGIMKMLTSSNDNYNTITIL